MITKFIKLKASQDYDLHIQPMMITGMESRKTTNPYDIKTVVYTIGGSYWHVMETVDEILTKIQNIDPSTIIHYDPKKP